MEHWRVFEMEPCREAIKQNVIPKRLLWMGSQQSFAFEFAYEAGTDRERAKAIASKFLIEAYDARAIKFFRQSDKDERLFYATFDWGR